MNPAPQTTFEVERHLRQMNDELLKALMRRDVATLDRILADDFLVTYPLEGDDKTQFVGEVASGDLKIEHVNRGQVTVRVFGNTAILTARDSSTWLYHGRELSGQYKILEVYSQREGQWKLCALQACPIHS